MNMISPQSALRDKLMANVVRHSAKSFDWDAFPGSRGFPDLQRAQMRYIGAGGSPKVGEPGNLPPEHFTMSLVYKPVGNFAACHSHEIEESFLIINGVLTVGWEQNGEVVEAKLGPKDMVLNARDIGHGFRNDGVEPVLMSISVDVGEPRMPVYLFHPKDVALGLARNFGAQPGKTMQLDPKSDHPLQQVLAKHVIRYTEQPTIWDPAGFSRKVYVGPGGVESDTCRKEMLGVPAGVGVKPYTRDVEDAFMVLEGTLTVGWEENGEKVEAELGPRDVVLNPAGRAHWFRNNSASGAVVWSAIGTSKPETVKFERA